MLSEEQQKIVETVDGRVLVVACPGSGKTTTMLERIHYMINTKNIDPRRILMVTFTKNAADEMMTRFKQKYPNDGEVCFATIHSICFGILRTEFNGLFKRKNESIYICCVCQREQMCHRIIIARMLHQWGIPVDVEYSFNLKKTA